VSNDAAMNRIGLEGYRRGIILSNVPERTERKIANSSSSRLCPRFWVLNPQHPACEVRVLPAS
jgi:hypothetical protein